MAPISAVELTGMAYVHRCISWVWLFLIVFNVKLVQDVCLLITWWLVVKVMVFSSTLRWSLVLNHSLWTLLNMPITGQWSRQWLAVWFHFDFPLGVGTIIILINTLLVFGTWVLWSSSVQLFLIPCSWGSVPFTDCVQSLHQQSEDNLPWL